MAKIMVIDDNDVILETLGEILTLEGFEVITFNSSTSGIKAIKEFEPDLIISDLFMPDKDGYDIIKEVKSINKSCKIIIISGFGGQDETSTFLDMAKKLGADDVVSKPIISDNLIEKINTLIS